MFLKFLFIETSRRDDLISLIYTLIFTMEKTLPWIVNCTIRFEDYYNIVKKKKLSLLPHEVCIGSSRKNLYI